MRFMSSCLVFALCLAALVHRVSAGVTDAEIEEILRARVDVYKRSVGIVVGVVSEEGRRVVGYGRMRRDGDREVDGKTVFEVGSVTKVFTTTLLADMVRRGEVRFDDPVSKFLPASVQVPGKDGKEITLLDLATHTSGLPRLPENMEPADSHNPYADYTVEQMYAFLSGYTLTRGIGEAYEYSNLGAGLLGHALALKAGMGYEALVRTRICDPLRMNSTAIRLSPELQARLATGHDAGLETAKNWDLPALAGAGALRSTAEDLLQFLAANVGLVESGLTPAMRETHAGRYPTGMPNLEIGLGWHVIQKNGTEIVWHNGGTGGYRSIIGFDKKQRRGVVVLSNSPHDVDDIGRHLLAPTFPLAELEVPKVRKAVKLAPGVYGAYVGEYELSPEFVLAVSQEAGKLFVQATGQPKFEVFPESETKFFYKVVEAQITFVKDEGGQVTHLVLHQNGQDVRALRRGAVVADEPTFELAPEVLERYVGKYELAPGFVLTVSRAGEQLMVQATGQPNIPIFAESETKFFYRVVDAQIVFHLNEKGQVEGLTLFQGGREMPGKKVK